MSRARLSAAVAAGICSVTLTHAGEVPCRDRFLQPFDEHTSIWNVAIGSGAQYVPAGIYPPGEEPTGIHNDQEFVIRAFPTDPLADWMDDSGNFPGSCTTKGPVRTQLPMPRDFVTDCEANNNAAGLLLPDNETLVQMQPLYRGEAGGPFVAWYHNGAPQPFPWVMNVSGDGNLGSHGGSGLSGFGGSIRLGELLNTTGPIQHALKLELWAHRYYYWDGAAYDTCYTWPAIGCDSYFNRTAHPGSGYNGPNPYLKPGALLAIRPQDYASLVSQLRTVPALKMARALLDYGGLIVDDTGSQQGGGAFCAEHGVTAEVQAAYGWSIGITNPLTPTQGAPLYNDLVTLFRALSVVTNNTPETLKGGGTPRQPPLPPLCPAVGGA